ncbi:MAG: ATP-binding protein [Cyanobacteriota bacterium]|nr:ATP-binding protein [Cyanobacteriota bacterium]
MTQIFGDFDEGLPISEEFLVIGFSPSSIPLKQRWRNNGLSADFMADYLMTFFLGNDSDPTLKHKQAEIRSAIGFIANELLENAMKFNDESSPYPISIRLQLYAGQLMFVTRNSVPPDRVPPFKLFLTELMASDPAQMYIRQLEKNAIEENSGSSGLGFLTMMSDYLAKLGWKFETVCQDPKTITVTTMVQLTV